MNITSLNPSIDAPYRARLYPENQEGNFPNNSHANHQGDRYIHAVPREEMELNDVFQERLSAEQRALPPRSEQLFEAVTGRHTKTYPTSYFSPFIPINEKKKRKTECMEEGLSEEKRSKTKEFQRRISPVIRNLTHTSTTERQLPYSFYSHDIAKGRENNLYFCTGFAITQATLDDLQPQPIYLDTEITQTVQIYQQGPEHLFFGRKISTDVPNSRMNFVKSILDPTTGRVLLNIREKGNPAPLGALASSDSDLMYMGTWNGGVFLHDKRQKGVVTILPSQGDLVINDTDYPENQEAVNSLALAPNRTQLAIGTIAGKALIFDIRKREVDPLYTLQGTEQGMRALTWTPDSQRLLTGGGTFDRTMRLFDMSKPTVPLIGSWRVGCQITNITFLTDQLFAITGAMHTGIWRYKEQTCEFLEKLTYNFATNKTMSALYYPQSKTLLTTEAETIRKWNMRPLVTQFDPVVIPPREDGSIPLNFNFR